MDAVAEAFAGPFPLDPEGGRAAYDALGEANPPDSETRWEAAGLGGIGGPNSEWQWWDGVDDDRIVLYFHGGGYVVGSPPTWRCFAALALRDAGVEVSIDICDGAIHGYHMFAPHTPEAAAGTTRLAKFLDARLA